MPRRGNWTALGAVLIGLFGLAGTAHAATTGGEFVCRSSAARAVTLGNPPLATVEPVRANVNGTPCASDQNAETVKPTTIGPITADAVRAYTTYTPGTNPSVSSDAIVTAPRIVLGGLSIGVDAIEAHASATCTSATTPPTLASSSKVVNLTINGNTLAIPGNSQPFVLNLSPLIKLSLNEKVTSTAGIVTQRAVHITALGNDVVIGEAIAGASTGNPCAGVTPPPGPTPCPPGSTYDATQNVCEIVTSTGQIIIVGLPYQGPSGGRVITLAEARRLYPHNPCVHGPGPQYVVVGTNHADRITGTNKADRIILLGGNDAAEGGRGNDCIDGGSGSDTLSGALGKDRMYGDSGNDHLAGGPQTDKLYGGSGNDSISAGFGSDLVSGGAGNDHINTAQAGPAAHVNCGSGRKDKARINQNEVRFERGCERVFVLRVK
ncbi:MAG: putative protease [Solirubrobacterales bacterium]|nr:putative protease [Solirubrobacterales bacterium]